MSTHCIKCGILARRNFSMNIPNTSSCDTLQPFCMHWSCYDMFKGIVYDDEHTIAVQCRKSYAFKAIRQFHAYIKQYVRQNCDKSILKGLQFSKVEAIPARVYESDVFTTYYCPDLDRYASDITHKITDMCKERAFKVVCMLNAPMSFRRRPQIKRLKTKKKKLKAPILDIVLPQGCLQLIYDYALEFKSLCPIQNIMGTLVGTRLNENENNVGFQNAHGWCCRFTTEELRKRKKERMDAAIQETLKRGLKRYKNKLIIN